MASKILLADDSITIQKVVNRAFAEEGIEVVAVSSGDQAERHLNDVSPDLVLADIFMPGKNGYELCESIKHNPRFRHVPVVLLVGAFEPFDQAEAKRVHADDHLTKPFEFRTLIETVRRLLDASSQPRTGPLPAMPAVEEEPVRPLEPRPSGVLAAPSFKIDLDAMSQPAVASEGGFAARPDAPPSALDDNAPLELDYGAQEGDSFGVINLEFGSEPASTRTADLGAPEWKQRTGEFSSVSEGIAGFTDQTLTEPLELDEAAPPSHEGEGLLFEPETSEGEPQGFSLESVEAHSDLPMGAGVPSRFSADADNVVLDFEKSVMPEPVITPGELEFTPESESLFEVVRPEAGEQTPGGAGAMEDDDFVTQRLDSALIEDFKGGDTNPLEERASASTSELAQKDFDASAEFPAAAGDESLFSIDEPLGDLLSDEAAASSLGGPEPAQQQEADSILSNAFELRFEPEQSTGFEVREPAAAPVEQPGGQAIAAASDGHDASAVEVEQAATEARYAEHEQPAETAPPFESSYDAAETIEDSQPEGSVWPDQAFAGGPGAEGWAGEDAAEPREFQAEDRAEASSAQVESKASFTSSSMWTAEEARFAPIDIEAVPVDERVAEPVEPQAEKGFEFSAPTADLAEPTTATEVEATTEAEAPASQGGEQAAVIDEIVRRVVAQMSDAVVREIAWEVVPDAVERVIEKLAREQLRK